MTDRPLEGRLAVITGASRGLGYHGALALAAHGAHIVAIARTVGGLEELDDAISETGGTSTLVPLDLRDEEGLDRLAPSLAERWESVDILIGNAGYLSPLTPVSSVKDDEWAKSMAVNVASNLRLLRSLDPLLRRSTAATALFMTSGATRSQRAYTAPYAASKAALEALVGVYAAEMKQTRVTANLIDPGTMRTRMRAQYAPGEDPETVTPPEDVAARLPRIVLEARERNGRTYDFKENGWR